MHKENPQAKHTADNGNDFIADVVWRSEQCKHKEIDLIRNNKAGYKCICGKEITYF